MQVGKTLEPLAALEVDSSKQQHHRSFFKRKPASVTRIERKGRCGDNDTMRYDEHGMILSGRHPVTGKPFTQKQLAYFNRKRKTSGGRLHSKSISPRKHHKIEPGNLDAFDIRQTQQ